MSEQLPDTEAGRKHVFLAGSNPERRGIVLRAVLAIEAEATRRAAREDRHDLRAALAKHLRENVAYWEDRLAQHPDDALEWADQIIALRAAREDRPDPEPIDAELLAHVLNDGRYTGSMVSATGWAADISRRYAAALRAAPDHQEGETA